MLPLIDVHAHIGESLFGVSQSVEQLLETMSIEGIVHSVISPLKPRAYEFGPENERIAEAVRAHPAHLSGFARVDPWQREEALTELRRSVDSLGLIGLYLHPFEEQFAANDELIFPLLHELERLRLPLLLAGGYPVFSHPSQIGDLARHFPGLKIIVTHGGQLNISGLLLADAGKMMRTNANLYMETSGIYREDFIEDTVTELGAGRVMFGSNAPYMDQGFEAARIRLAHLTDDQRATIGAATAREACQLN